MRDRERQRAAPGGASNSQGRRPGEFPQGGFTPPKDIKSQGVPRRVHRTRWGNVLARSLIAYLHRGVRGYLCRDMEDC